MTIKKPLTSIDLGGITLGAALAGTLILATIGISRCNPRQPEVKNIKDFTGDGIADVMIDDSPGRYLFIGQENGTYIRTKGYIIKEDSGLKQGYGLEALLGIDSRGIIIEYFKSDEGVAYFFDGNFYRPSPKQE